MSKHIESITRELKSMSPEELQERIREIRRNKHTAKPAGVAARKREVKSKVAKALEGLSKEQLQRLLEEGNG